MTYTAEQKEQLRIKGTNPAWQGMILNNVSSKVSNPNLILWADGQDAEAGEVVEEYTEAVIKLALHIEKHVKDNSQ